MTAARVLLDVTCEAASASRALIEGQHSLSALENRDGGKRGRRSRLCARKILSNPLLVR